MRLIWASELRLVLAGRAQPTILTLAGFALLAGHVAGSGTFGITIVYGVALYQRGIGKAKAKDKAKESRVRVRGEGRSN